MNSHDNIFSNMLFSDEENSIFNLNDIHDIHDDFYDLYDLYNRMFCDDFDDNNIVKSTLTQQLPQQQPQPYHVSSSELEIELDFDDGDDNWMLLLAQDVANDTVTSTTSTDSTATSATSPITSVATIESEPQSQQDVSVTTTRTSTSVNKRKRKTTASARTAQSNRAKKLKLPQQISGLALSQNPYGIIDAKLKQKGQRSYYLPLFSPGHTTRPGTKIVAQFQSEAASKRGTMEVQYKDSVSNEWAVAFECRKVMEKDGSWGKKNGDGSVTCTFTPSGSQSLDKRLPWMRAVFKCDDGTSCVLFYFGYCNRDDRAERSEQYLAAIPVDPSKITQQILHCHLN